MATKKKSIKKTPKNSSTLNETSDNTQVSFGRALLSWFLIIAGVLLLIGCIYSVYNSSINGVPLTQFVGIFGKFSTVFFIASLILWGLYFLKVVKIRYPIGMLLITFEVSALMSYKHYGFSNVSWEVYSKNGGVLGQFLQTYIGESLFGKSIFFPITIIILCFIATLVVCFGLRPKHFALVVKFFKNGPKDNSKQEESDLEGNESLRSGITMDGDTTIFNIPNTFKTKRKGVLKPFSAKKNWMESVDTFVSDSENASASEPTMTEETIANTQVSTHYEDDPEILRLKQELKENEHRMSALEIKEIRGKIAEIRRAQEEIKWENERKGNLVVKGAVRGEENSSETKSTESDLVNDVALNSSESIINDNAETLAITPDNLLGGDGSTDFVESEEDTFVPEIVTADDVGEEPSFIETTSSSKTQGALIPQADPTQYDEYKIPLVSEILEEHEQQTADYTVEELNAIGKMLEEKLENFKVKGKVVGCETGPMITRFEVEPGPGVKVSQFSALHEDLALALKVTSIRILTPIPGKGAVGIEIPNRKFQTVYGRDIFESESFSPSSDKILVALGKDITGEAFTMDLAKAPHLMIAGQTGSGKSVCINALMASILFSKTPDELRMILVDPKAVELKMYENIPHLLAPVITKPEIAIQALQWLCYEMDRRTEVLATAKVRNLLGFNEKYKAGELPEDVPIEDRSRPMPFIVVIIDEMADLMMVAGKEIEKSVSRLAAKARAVGIHLVLATQRPSVKVITGNIKANLPTRISFKVASQVDARTVMDHAGAEKLLGRGDMLFKAVNAPDPVRVHGAFLSDEEAENLANACSNQNVYYPQIESFDVSESEDGEEGADKALNEKLDKLLFDVAKWAIEVNGLSTSAVQRHFSVGYSRAGKIVDQLFALGICGPTKGNSKPRSMLVGMDELLNLERSGKLG